MNDFELVPVVTTNTRITVVTFHIRCIFIVRSLFFRTFSASFLITFLSPEFATSVRLHVLFLLSGIMASGVLLGMLPCC